MTKIRPGIYRHFKGGEYQVLGLAQHSETDEVFVVYKPLYNKSGLWVRPAVMFTEKVNIDGVDQDRFEFVSDGY